VDSIHYGYHCGFPDVSLRLSAEIQSGYRSDAVSPGMGTGIACYFCLWNNEFYIPFIRGTHSSYDPDGYFTHIHCYNSFYRCCSALIIFSQVVLAGIYPAEYSCFSGHNKLRTDNGIPFFGAGDN